MIWEASVYTYLRSLKNSHGVLLAYIIMKDLDVANADVNDREQQIIHNASLDGSMLNRDKK